MPPAVLRSLLIILLGYAAGAQLGKIAPIADALQATRDYSLVSIGWLTAIIGVFVALAAMPVSRLVGRIGSVKALKAGAIVLSAGALCFAFANTTALLLAARTIEAIGYVLLVIAAPAYLAQSGKSSTRPALLALWGSFVPVGYAWANLQAGTVTDSGEIAGFLMGIAIPMAALSLCVTLFVPVTPKENREIDRPAVEERQWLGAAVGLAICFGLYVYLSIGFFTFLPSFYAGFPSASNPAPWLVALGVPAGNLAATILVATIFRRHAPLLCAAGFVLSAMAAPLVFSGAAPWTTTLVLAFSGGIIASAVFASVPSHTGTGDNAAFFIGAIAQAGGLMTLLGPPLAGLMIETFSWQGLAASFTIASLIGGSITIALSYRTMRMLH